MTLTLHTQLENMFNLLRLRRAETLSRQTRQHAYLGLVAAILGVPVASLGEMVPATVSAQPRIVALPTPRSRVA